MTRIASEVATRTLEPKDLYRILADAYVVGNLERKPPHREQVIVPVKHPGGTALVSISIRVTGKLLLEDADEQ